MRPAKRVDRSEGLSALLVALIAAVAAAGAAVAAGAALQWDNEDLSLLAVLAGLAVFSVRFDISLFYQSRVSVTVVPVLVAGTIAGLPGILVVALAAELAAYLGRGKHYYKSIFNAGALLLSGAAYLGVLHSFSFDTSSDQWPALLLPAVVGILVNFLVNSSLVALAVALATKHSIVTVWKGNYGSLLPHYVILGVLVAGMASAYWMDGIATMALVYVPVAIMRFGIKLQQVHRELSGAHQQLKVANNIAQRAYDGTLRSLMAALDKRDTHTGHHSERVAKLALAIAKEMGIEPGSATWNDLSCGALLHDVGKIAVPDAILRKEGDLSSEEWELMRIHPQSGFEIVGRVEFLKTAADMILAHHERFDGSGYPRGLAGEEIPLAARIFAVADAFDAMTSHRPYRQAIVTNAAIEEIRRCSGTQFDPKVVEAFLEAVSRWEGEDPTRSAGAETVLLPASLSVSSSEA